MPDRPDRRRIARLLSRITFVPNVGDIERVRTFGLADYVDAQLDWRSLDVTQLEANLSCALPTLGMSRAALLDGHGADQDAMTQRRPVVEWRAATRARRNASPRQLQETMIDVWSRHFGLGESIDAMLHDREVVREHALGRYADLLKASARSPAMLARERRDWLRDLTTHYTRGPAPGGGDAEIETALRCFSGWTVDDATGGLRFVPALHDFGAKRVFGLLLPAGGGVEDGDALIDRLVCLPATARNVCALLVRRFVGFDARDLIDVAALVFAASRGDIAATVRFVLGSARFAESVGLDAEEVAARG